MHLLHSASLMKTKQHGVEDVPPHVVLFCQVPIDKLRFWFQGIFLYRATPHFFQQQHKYSKKRSALLIFQIWFSDTLNYGSNYHTEHKNEENDVLLRRKSCTFGNDDMLGYMLEMEKPNLGQGSQISLGQKSYTRHICIMLL